VSGAITAGPESRGSNRERRPQGRQGVAPRTVGVLALQGGFEAHERIVRGLGAHAREVRVPSHLDGLDALIIPGGESTVMTLGMERDGLAGPLRELVRRGTPVLGTCAGMIMLDRDHLGLLDITTERNAFGRQLRSFECDLELSGISGGPVHAVFIRAPWVGACGDGVQVMAAVDGHPVAVRQGNVVAIAFHPELAGESRVHALVLGLDGGRAAADGGGR
jgi:pyridoxal 5'-phosphate synthase pdxT subunit